MRDKSLAEFAARMPQIKFNHFRRAAFAAG